MGASVMPLSSPRVDDALAAPSLLALLDRYQRDFPLQDEPYRQLARQAGMTESALLQALAQLRVSGVLSRVGAVFAPGSVGASTLAALAVPPARLDTVAAMVSSQPEVNHNYARDHHYNLWFVIAAADRAAVDATLARIAAACGQRPLDLPLLREYHIDLGFALGADGPPRRATRSPPPQRLTVAERALVAALHDGLPLSPRPFAVLAAGCGMDEGAVLAQLARWQASGVLRRFGFVLRHHELGFRGNAMCVWQVDEHARDAIGARLATDPAVNLCYARPAQGAHWPYNLFCMIHCADAASARQQALALAQRHQLQALPQAVLVSSRRYTQRGARYGALPHASS